MKVDLDSNDLHWLIEALLGRPVPEVRGLELLAKLRQAKSRTS